jgi:hypothetical protein
MKCQLITCLPKLHSLFMRKFSNYILFISVLGLCLVFTTCKTSKTKIVNRIEPNPAILLGVWQLKDASIFEKWAQISVTEYLGVLYDMSTGIAQINKSMRVYKSDDNWFFFEVKTNENKYQAVQFVWSPDPLWPLKFINEKNDYPNVVKYRITEDSSLITQISTLQGEKVKEFIFHKFVMK